MRETKFRVWDKINKRFSGISHCITQDARLLTDVDPNGMDMSGMTNFRFDSNYEFAGYATGLHDKNSKKIYEGDILKDDEDYLLEVRFGELPLDKSGDCVCTYPAFYCKCHGKMGQSAQYKCEEIGEKWMAIIGNIYENPELLK